VYRAAIVAPIGQMIPRLIIDNLLHDLLRTTITQRPHPLHSHFLLHDLLSFVQLIDHVIHLSDYISSGDHSAISVAVEDGCEVSLQNDYSITV
jgi:hypothetical protein